MRFSVCLRLGTRLAISRSQGTITPRSTAMKFETLMLHSLFVACLVICFTTLGSMLV
jgi:hypothetical protein